MIIENSYIYFHDNFLFMQQQQQKITEEWKEPCRSIFTVEKN